MTQYTVLGPGGAPMRPPWGSFAGKPFTGGDSKSYTQQFTVLGPAGATMRPPWGSFAGRAPVANADAPHNLRFFCDVGSLMCR